MCIDKKSTLQFITKQLKKYATALMAGFVVFCCVNRSSAQFRKIHYDAAENVNIQKFSFYSASEGYIALSKSIGFTADSGRTVTVRPITNNVDFNGYGVNLTFGFEPGGVHVFSKNNIIVYGSYALVPAILYSADGGLTFKLVYHSQYSFVPNSTVEDMLFLPDGKTGFAIDRDRVLKTTDGGLTWDLSSSFVHAYNARLQLGGTRVFAGFSDEYGNSNMITTENAGTSWNTLHPPVANVNCFYVLNANTFWINNRDGDTYVTKNGGISWAQQNDDYNDFSATQMIFTDANIGYGLSNSNFVYKTTDGGKYWEQLTDNSTPAQPASVTTMQVLGNNVWAGGDHAYIEICNNGGGLPVPHAAFAADTVGLFKTGAVKLTNYSKTGYNYRWIVNGKVVATSYNATYNPDIYGNGDTIELVVSNAKYADTASTSLNFGKGIVITRFYPETGRENTQVIISGYNFKNITSVTIGGVPAKSFSVFDEFTVSAYVDKGGSGPIKVSSAKSSGKSASSFTYLYPPSITSFSPTTIKKGDILTIKGANLSQVYAVNPASSGFKVVSDSVITAVMGYGVSGDVGVYGTNGFATFPGLKVLPVIDSIAAHSGNYGTLVSIYGAGFPDSGTVVTVDGHPVLNVARPYPEHVDVTLGEGDAGIVKVTTPTGSYTYDKFTYYQKPVITTFSPLATAAGKSVTISGQNFSPVAAENFVYFGTSKGAVTAATATSLTVTVPYGATYGPISVVTRKSIAYSNQYFTPNFKDGGTLSAESFIRTKDIRFAQTYGMELADLNNDDKLEIIIPRFGNGVYGYNGHSLAAIVYKNTSQTGDYSFEEYNMNFDGNGGSYNGTTNSFGITDYDYDGKLDMLLPGDYNFDTGILYINNADLERQNNFFRKIGDVVISHGNFDLHSRNFGIVINDFDGDGKTDKIFFTPLYNSYKALKAADLDNDGKPDLIETNSDSLMIYKNICAKGDFKYQTKIKYLVGGEMGTVTPADIDGDGKVDIIVTTNYYTDTPGKIILLKNTSTAAGISFVVVTLADGIPKLTNHALGDVDGDGKVDILVASDKQVLLYKNTSTTGSFSVAGAVNLQLNASIKVAVGDMDNDGKPDIIGLGYDATYSYVLHILKNIMGAPQVTFSPAGGAAGTTITITGSNFTGTTAVRIGGVNVKSFTVNSATAITAVVDDCITGPVIVESPSGYQTSVTQFVFVPKPAIVAYGPLVFEAGGSLGLSTAVFDANLTYQWQKDGIDIPGANTRSLYVTEKGSYTVKNTFGTVSLISDAVLVRTSFTLPADNFKIGTTSISCKGNANGNIGIIAVKPFKYMATVTSAGFSTEVNFTTNTILTGLNGGNYNVCITIDGQPDFKQCFDVVIFEPKDLSVYSTVDQKYVNLVLDGGSVYNIKINEKEYTTTQSSISLPLVAGTNRLVITTDKLCQGIIEKLINYTDNLKPYPNPFVNSLNINLGNKVVNSALIEIRDVKNGSLLYKTEYRNQTGVVNLNLEGFKTGVYILNLSLDGKQNVYKILK